MFFPLLLSVGWPDSGGPSVDAAALEIRATDLRRALPTIGERFGKTIRAAPAIEDEIIVARIGNASLEEVEAHLAGEFGGEWKTGSDGTLTLVPSSRLRAAQEREWTARRTRMARAMVDRMKAQLGEALPVTPASAKALAEWAKRQAIAEQKDEVAPDHPNVETPATRLMNTILGTLPADEVAGPVAKTRTVYALRPTPMQVALPPSVAAAYDKYVRDDRLLDPDAAPAGFYLARQTEADGVYWELTVYDGAGRQIDVDTLNIPLQEWSGSGGDGPGSDEAAAEAAKRPTGEAIP